MNLSDRTTGLVLVGLGVLAWSGASRLPPMAGQAVGPSVFPTVIGAGLCLCGILIALGIGRTFEEDAGDLTTDQPRSRGRPAGSGFVRSFPSRRSRSTSWPSTAWDLS